MSDERERKTGQYSYTIHIENDYITAELLEALFQRFSANGPYFRAQSTRSTPPIPKKEVQTAFALLDISVSSSAEEIKKAFKAKALLTHPDRGGSHTEMVRLNQAKDVALRYAER